MYDFQILSLLVVNMPKIYDKWFTVEEETRELGVINGHKEACGAFKWSDDWNLVTKRIFIYCISYRLSASKQTNNRFWLRKLRRFL